MNDEFVINELVNRYIYLYENRRLILALCIDRDIDRKHILSKISEYKRLLKTNVVCKSNKELSSMIKKDIDYYKRKLYIDNYYLMANVNDSIVSMFCDFLFSDKKKEELDLYKHIEAVKGNKEYLDAFNYSIELLEERKRENKEVVSFTVWRILDYVRKMAYNDKVLLNGLDKYYNIDRFMITGDDYISGYYFLEEDYVNLGEESLNKYPCNRNSNNSFEDNECYFARLIYDNSFNNSSNFGYSYFLLRIASMNNLDIHTKSMIRERVSNNKLKNRTI